MLLRKKTCFEHSLTHCPLELNTSMDVYPSGKGKQKLTQALLQYPKVDFSSCTGLLTSKEKNQSLVLLLLGGRGGRPCLGPPCPPPCIPLAVWKLECVLRPLTVRSGPRAEAATSTALFSFTMLLMIRRRPSSSPESNPYQRSVCHHASFSDLWAQSSMQLPTGHCLQEVCFLLCLTKYNGVFPPLTSLW